MSIYKFIGASIAIVFFIFGFGLNVLAAPASDASPLLELLQDAQPQSQPQNVLLILADDIGVDILSVYGEGEGFPVTPTIDRMTSEGVLFRNVWSTPKCSPTRATILTGRYGFRTGITGRVTSTDLNALSIDEITLPEVLKFRTQTHQEALIGKWHLGNCLNGQNRSPNLAGFSHYAGSFANVVNNDQSFFEWKKTVNGRASRVQAYATTDNVDDAIEWIGSQSDPWFLHLSFNAPHEPWQIPPHHLVSPSTLAQLPKDESGNPRPASTDCEGDDRRICYLAMVEAMDAEIGRLLASLPPDVSDQTTVIFLGDNGTPPAVTRPPFDRNHAKNTLYEGGINVPLIVRGAGVENPNRESAALINTTDMFATILELATGRQAEDFLPTDLVHDSVSFVPILKNAPDAQQRTYVFSELFHPTRTQVLRQFGQAIRNERYKLIRLTTQQREEFYDLEADPFEQNNLLLNELNDVQMTHYDVLRQQLANLLAPTQDACPIEAVCSDCNACVISDVDDSACRTLDTETQSCRRPDLTEFSCPEGQTIHKIRCPCTGSSACSSRHDQQLVCAPGTPVSGLIPGFPPLPDADPTFEFDPDPEPGPALEPDPTPELDPTPEPDQIPKLDPSQASGKKNVLLILADDIGVDILSVYGEGEGFPITPTIDRMASEGVLFRNAWSTPKCSSTRATILTGRYGFRTGIGSIVSSRDLTALSIDEITLPEVLKYRTQTHAEAMVGKWHLGNCLNGQKHAPNLAGFSHYTGSLANIVNQGQSFFEWKKTVNGKSLRSHTYATTDSVDDAIEWIGDQNDPWFLYLSLNAPHEPFQIPPHHLVSPSTLAQLPKDELGNPRPPGTHCEGIDLRLCYLAMVEAMDAELGRLLASLPPGVSDQTTVIFAGDNGTPPAVTRAPFAGNHAKGTLYEGGINVPLIVHGARVEDPNRESATLVNTTDLFATTLELATGQHISDILPPDLIHDSVSFVPILENASDAEQRTYAYSEFFNLTNSNTKKHFGQTIRNERYKLIRLTTLQREEFYDLEVDPFEQNDLLLNDLNDVQAANLDALRQQFAELLAPTVNACPIESACSDCNRCVVSDGDPGTCSVIDTEAQFCQRADTTQFSCPEGQTIHMMRCACTGEAGICLTRHDQQLVCQ